MQHNLRIILLLLVLPLALAAQSPEQHAKSRLENLLYYLGKEKKAPDGEIARLADLLVVAENDQKPRRERTQSWLEIHHYFFKITEDPDTTFQKRWLQFGGYPLFSAYFNHKLPDYQLTKSTATPDSSPGNVKKYGNGEETLILIPPAGFDPTIYEEFIAQNQDHYTIFMVTLPGFGGVPPYLRQARRNLAEMSWFNNIENGLLALLKKEKVDKAFVLGNGLGGFIAMRFGLNHPGKVKGIITVNGLLSSPIPSMTTAGKSAMPDERLSRMETLFPQAEFVPYSMFQPYGSFQSGYSIKSEAIRSRQIENIATTDIYAYRIYMEQLKAMDINHALKNLQVPLLAFTSVQDGLSPMVTFSRTNVIAWQKLDMKYPNKPIHLIPLQKTRDLALYDRPEEVAGIIHQFTKNLEAFEGLKLPEPTWEVNKSPRASASQTFSNTDISISYSRPSVSDRELFGKLIPIDKLWRAGANEGTEITFSRDIRINNQSIAKGRYTLFIKPGKDKWTIILNSILNQWNTTHYDPDYDVVHFDIIPSKAAHMERLKYDFENLTDHSVDLTIHWGTTKAVIPIEETFKTPYAPESIQKFAWNLLLTDTIADGQNPNSSDGKALYYYHETQTDSIWFKLETHNRISTLDPAISISLDTDNDQSTGASWYGSNRTFKVDLMLSVGPVRQGNGYSGYNGITDAEGITNREWINVIKGNLTYYFDRDGSAYYLGVKRTDLGEHTKSINLIGSVGANSRWNDDIGKDGTFATIELKK